MSAQTGGYTIESLMHTATDLELLNSLSPRFKEQLLIIAKASMHANVLPLTCESIILLMLNSEPKHEESNRH